MSRWSRRHFHHGVRWGKQSSLFPEYQTKVVSVSRENKIGNLIHLLRCDYAPKLVYGLEFCLDHGWISVVLRSFRLVQRQKTECVRQREISKRNVWLIWDWPTDAQLDETQFWNLLPFSKKNAISGFLHFPKKYSWNNNFLEDFWW